MLRSSLPGSWLHECQIVIRGRERANCLLTKVTRESPEFMDEHNLQKSRIDENSTTSCKHMVHCTRGTWLPMALRRSPQGRASLEFMWQPKPRVGMGITPKAFEQTSYT